MPANPQQGYNLRDQQELVMFCAMPILHLRHGRTSTVRKYRSTNAGRDHPHTSFEPSWTRFPPASEAFSSPASTTGVVPISPSEMLASILDRAVIEVTVCRACQVCIALCLCGIEGEKISIAVARLRGACRALLRGYANRSHLPPFLKMASRCSLLFLKVVSR